MTDYSIVTADQIDRSEFERFFRRVYPDSKNRFLQSYGKWWHRGDQHRWAISANGQIAGYCGVIPTKCLINGSQVRAWWWVDLIVAPEFRGQGLESILDREVREKADVKLGFPNELASKIHRKHGWAVREDLQVLMLPLRPLNVKKVRSESGFRRFLLQLGALGITPLASIGRRSLEHYTPLNVEAVESASADMFEAVFDKYKKEETATTYRDAEYIKWRYLDAPYRSELAYYLTGRCSSPTHFLIARNVSFLGVKTTRILDVFGDFADLQATKDILKTAVRDAILRGSSQVTALVTLPELQSVFRSIGFLIRTKARFCCLSASETIMRSLAGRNYWTLADSDNDAPE